MKNESISILKIKFVASLLAIFVLIGVIANYFFAGEESVISKIVTGASVIENREAPEIEEVHSVYMLVNELHVDDDRNLDGNEIKLTAKSEGITVTAYSVVGDQEISPNEEGNIVVPENGIKVKVDGVKLGNSYELEIENKKVNDDYVETFKNAIIRIDAETNGNINGYVKTITSVENGREVTTNGSKEKTAIFMYEDSNNKIKIAGNTDVKIYYVKSTDIDGMTEEELKSAEWQVYNNNDGIIAENNCVIYAKSQYKTGEYSEISEIVVDNIDKIAPEIVVTPQTEEAEDETFVDVVITESENKLYGASGIVKYAMTEEEEEPTDEEYITIESANRVETKIEGIVKNGTYYLWAKDKAGNVSHVPFTVSNIKIKIVAIILESPVAELVGTEYETLNQLMEALEEKGLTKSSEKTVVQIVNDVKDETTEINNKNLEIDLNGYTISSNSISEKTLDVKSANVTIVDNKYKISDKISNAELANTLETKYSSKKVEGVAQVGEVQSKKNIAIEISNDSTLQLGEDDGAVSITAPIVEGDKKAIHNNGGTFNYYDGVLIGKITNDGTTVIEGETVEKAITDTPKLFDPATNLMEGEDRFKTILAKVSGVEALIGKTRYTTIENAIEAANNVKGTSEEQVKIDVVTDITKENVIEVDSTKNILLNLNGYTITNSIEDYIFKNNGKMEIVDGKTSEDVNIDLSTVQSSNDQYYFEYEDGKLKSNNQGVSSSTANSYVEIDLRGKENKYTLSVNAEISSESRYDVGYAIVTTSPETPDLNTTKLINNISGSVTASDYTTELESGNLYYLHFGYSKDGSVDSGTDTFTINSIKCLAGDANGTITSSTSHLIKNEEGAELKLTSGTIIVDKESGYGINNEGKLTINGGTLKAAKDDVVLVNNEKNGKIEVNGGKFYSNSTSYKRRPIGIKNNAEGTGENVVINDVYMEMTGHDYDISTYAKDIVNSSTSTLTIKGGTITSTYYSCIGVYNTNAGIINIEGGVITHSIQNGNVGTINIKGDETNISGYISNNGNGTINIENGNITSSIKVEGRGTINITGGNINRDGYGYAIDIDATGTVNIKGGTISNSSNNSAIYMYRGGTLNIEGGIITSSNSDAIEISGHGDGATIKVTGGTITSTNGSGINNSVAANVTIGTKDGEVKEEPVIIGSTYGVYNKTVDGKINYYDGVLKGKTKAIEGIINDIEENKDIILSNEDDYEVARLGNVEKIAYVGDDETNTYDSLEEAIEDCGQEGKITLLKDIMIVTGREKTIPGNTKITLNLNGKEIKTLTKEKSIVNKGELTITDLSEGATGKLGGYGKSIIVNEEGKTLNIEKGTIELIQYNSYGNDYLSAIINNGTTNIKDGAINTTSEYSYAVNNTGNIEMTGGSITVSGNYGYGIKNTGTGTIKILEGNLEIKGSVIENRSSDSKSVEISGGSLLSHELYVILNIGTGGVIINNGTINSISTGTPSGGIENQSSGNIEVNGGNITASRGDGICNDSSSTGKVIVTGGTITSTNEFGINNTNSGTIEVMGGTINSSDTWHSAIANTSTGKVIVTGGTITGTRNAGIYNRENGTVTIGIKDGNVKTTPIIAGSYGVYNNDGTFYFYDGILKGGEGQSTYGKITEIEDGYTKKIYKNGESNKYDIEIGEGNEIAVLEKVCVAKVESTGEEYTSLKDAVDSVSGTDKITILSEITLVESESTIEIENSKNITIDLAGNKINAGNLNVITNNGTLTIEDSSEGTKGTIVTSKSGTSDEPNNCIVNNGTLNINSGNIEGTSSNTNGITNVGTLNISGGKVKGTNKVIDNTETGKVIVTGGIIEGGSVGINNSENGIVTIENGTISGSSAIANSGTTTINNGTISGTVVNNSTGTLKMLDGTITSSTVGMTNNGTAEITGGKISVNEYSSTGIKNSGTLKIFTEEGKTPLEITAMGGAACGINNSSDGIVTIIDATIYASGSSGASAISNSGQMTIEGGNYEASYNNAINNTGTLTITGGNVTANGDRGTAISNNKGIVTLGTKDGEVKDTPVITANIYGINNSNVDGKVYYYDGIIKGKTESIAGVVNEIEENNQILLDKEDDYETAQLENMEKVAYVGDNESNTYDTLKAAIEACGQNGKVTMLKDVVLVVGQEQVISENAKITLNLNGKEVRAYTYEKTITNKGELTITDLSEVATGKLGGYGKSIIVNEEGKTLNVEKGTLELRQANNDYQDYLSCIVNSGIASLKGGNINTTTSYSYAISNTGTINITGGSITTSGNYGYGIKNSENGIVEITEGSIVISGYGADGIINRSNGKSKVAGGNITTSGRYGYGINNNDSGIIEMTGGSITTSGNSGYGIYNTGSGTLEMTGGTITSSNSYGIYNRYGEVTIKGGTITSSYSYAYAIENYYGTLNIENGTITGKQGIENYGITEVSGGTITGTNGTGLRNYSREVTIKGGKIVSETGIGIEISSGTVTLGENDDKEPSKTTPEIVGETYGVQNTNSGTFNFYDGIIKGATKAISGAVNDTPENYSVVHPNQSETEAVLEIIANVANTVEINGQYYDSFQGAITAIKNSDSKTATIRINNDLILNNSIEIPEGVNVTIALQGHRMLYKEEGVAITNKGTLTIMDFENMEDSDGDLSIIEAQQGIAINNEGTLTIGQENNKNTSSPKIKGTQAITGSDYTKLSGTIENTDTSVGTRTLKQIKAKQNSYAVGEGEGSASNKIALSTAPELTANLVLPTWTNDKVLVNAKSNVIPVLNLYLKDKVKTAEYTIEYYYDGEIDDSKTETLEGNIGEQVTEYTDKNIAGYKFDKTENLSLTISENAEENVIKVYYVKDSFDYKVEYYYDNVKDESKTETKKAEYESKMTESDVAIEANNKIGYKFDKTENLPLTISEKVEENVIKIYYIIDDGNTKSLNYTIEYYKDGEKQDEDTQIERKTVQILQPDTMEVDKTKINTTDKYVGYRLEKTEPSTIPDEVNNGDVIKVYYVKDEFNYTIEYYYDNVKDESKTETKKAEYESKITESDVAIEANNKIGYKFDKTENLPLTISENAEENVIKVYYVLDEDNTKELSYTVEYYKNGEKVEEDTQVETKKVQLLQPDKMEVDKAKINTTDKYYGYKVDSTDPTEIPDEVNNGDVIKVYYVIDEGNTKELKYIVEYYKEGVLQTSDTQTETTRVQVLQPDTMEVDKTKINITNKYRGYKLENLKTQEKGKQEKIVTEIPSKVKTETTIKVNYTRDNGNIVIKYLEKGTDTKLAEEEIKTGKIGDKYTIPEKEITGYKLVETEGNVEGEYDVETATIIFYYKQKTRVVVNHIDKETNEIMETEKQEGLVGDEYKASSKSFEGYVLVEKPTNETVTMTKEEIILNYYYSHVSEGVIEKHIDVISKEVLANEVHTGNEGDSYDIQSRTFEGYDLVETKLPTNAKGKMTKETIEVDYYYIRKTKVIAQYIDKITQRKLAEDETKTGHEEDNYETESKTFEGYDLVEEPTNAKGKMTRKLITVTYEYLAKAAGVVERHYDYKKNQLLETETKYEGHIGDEYSTKAKEFEGYDVLSDKLPENAKGTMTSELIEVNYYYIKKSTVRVKYVDKVTGKEIITEEKITGHEGDNYETKAKELKGYDIITEEMPENAKGTMTEKDIIVTYYYIRKAEVEAKYIDKTTGKEIAESVQIKGHEGDEYKTEQKEIDYYKFVESTDNTEGKMKVEVLKQMGGTEIVNNKIVVRYYYEPLKFNLKVTNNISQVIKDGILKNVSNGKLSKTEIHRKSLDSTSLQVEFTIEVTNDSEIDGKATLVERIPEGFEMKPAENEGWTIGDGIAQRKIEEIKVGETQEYKVVLDWIKGESNIGIKEDIVYIVDAENEAGFKETTEEDNQDKATMILTIATGEERETEYIVAMFTLSLVILMVMVLQRKK